MCTFKSSTIGEEHVEEVQGYNNLRFSIATRGSRNVSGTKPGIERRIYEQMSNNSAEAPKIVLLQHLARSFSKRRYAAKL